MIHGGSGAEAQIWVHFAEQGWLGRCVSWGLDVRAQYSSNCKWFFSFIKSQGGNATIYRVSEDLITTQDRFTKPEWIEKELQTKIKKKLDPKFIFNPGRLYSFI